MGVLLSIFCYLRVVILIVIIQLHFFCELYQFTELCLIRNIALYELAYGRVMVSDHP